MPIAIKSVETILKTHPFEVEELQMEKSGEDLDYRYHRIRCPDWANILPITSTGEAILIRQKRFGSEKSVLETPGGVVDPGEFNDPTMAAVRELEEETGFTTKRVLPLLSVNPNPAIQTNRVHLFVGLDCVPAVDRKHFPDDHEDIEYQLANVADLEEMVRTGQIDHSLSCLTIMLAKKYYEGLISKDSMR